MSAGLKLLTGAAIDIPSAGTAVQLTTEEGKRASKVWFLAASGNTGNIFFGQADVSSALYIQALAANGVFELTGPVELATLWVDAATSGNDVTVHWI